MRLNQIRIGATALALVVMSMGTLTAVMATEETSDAEVHVKKVHKIVVDCDEDSVEECEKAIHIESMDNGSHVWRLGDHERVWVEGGKHGAHYSFGSHFAGKGGFLGVQLTDLTPELRAHFGVPGDEGVMVAKVVDDSAAFRAGLAAGDIITRVGGEAIRSAIDLTHVIRAHEEDETLDLEFWRNGSPDSVTATLDKVQDLARIRRHVMIDCGEGEKDCGAHFVGSASHGMAIDCPDGEDCDIRVNCDDGDCECALNGERIDCQQLQTQHGNDN